MSESASLPVTERTRLRRLPKRGAYDRATIDAIIDEALICHVGVSLPDGGGPRVQPTTHWRMGDEIFIHGSVKNGLFAALDAGAEACLTISLLDGLVLARSAFHHSVNYRSVMVYGRARKVDEPEEKMAAFKAMIDKIAPGRWAEIRAPSALESKATGVYAFPIAEASAKLRAAPPVDDAEDYALPVWAGVIPLRLERGAPIPDPTPAPEPGASG